MIHATATSATAAGTTSARAASASGALSAPSRIRWLALLTLALALTVAGAIPFTALAGGWSVVVLDTVPSDVTSGQPVPIGFTVLQHGDKPVAGLRPSVKVTSSVSGETLSFLAAEEGAAGHYLAQVMFPHAATYTWVVDAFEGDHPMPPLTVRAAPLATPLRSASTSAAPASTGPIPLWLPLVVGSVVGALGLTALVVAWQRADVTARAR